jgi:hypothetical protein
VRGSDRDTRQQDYGAQSKSVLTVEASTLVMEPTLIARHIGISAHLSYPVVSNLRNWAGYRIRGRICRPCGYFAAPSSSRNAATLRTVRNTPLTCARRTIISRVFRWRGGTYLCAAAPRSGQWKNIRVYPDPQEENSRSRDSKSRQKPDRHTDPEPEKSLF